MKKYHTFIPYVILFLGIYWLTTVCEGIESFDLNRSYYEANTLADNYSVEQLILLRLASTVDFIYYLIHFFAIKASIPQNIVTTCIVFLFYFVAIHVVKNDIRKKTGTVLMLVALFIAPIIYSISVARNLTAFMFIYCAIYFYCKDRKLLSLILGVLGIFTHFTVLLYILILVIAIVFKNKRINELTLAVTLIGVYTVSLIFPSLIGDLLLNAISGHDLSYENYVGARMGNFIFDSAINYADKIPVIFALIFSILLLFWNKQKSGFEYWALFLLFSLLLFFMNTSFSLVLRCLMFMPIFMWLNVGKIIESASSKKINNLQLISWVGVFALLLHIYGYRQIYLSFL